MIIACNTATAMALSSLKNQFKDIHIFVDEELKNNSKGSTIIDCTSEDFSILRMGDGVFK